MPDPARDPRTSELHERWRAAERAMAGAQDHARDAARAAAKAERAAIRAEKSADVALRSLGVAHGRYRQHLDDLEHDRS